MFKDKQCPVCFQDSFDACVISLRINWIFTKRVNIVSSVAKNKCSNDVD